MNFLKKKDYFNNISAKKEKFNPKITLPTTILIITNGERQINSTTPKININTLSNQKLCYRHFWPVTSNYELFAHIYSFLNHYT